MTKLYGISRTQGNSIALIGKGIKDQDRNILSNQVLLLEFLRSVAGFLSDGPIPLVAPKRRKKDTGSEDEREEDSPTDVEEAAASVSPRGSVLVMLRNVPPYTLWDLPQLAKNPPPPKSSGTPPNPRYIQLRSFAVSRSSWKGYEHRMTKGERAHGQGTTGVGGEDRMWQFCLKD